MHTRTWLLFVALVCAIVPTLSYFNSRTPCKRDSTIFWERLWKLRMCVCMKLKRKGKNNRHIHTHKKWSSWEKKTRELQISKPKFLNNFCFCFTFHLSTTYFESWSITTYFCAVFKLFKSQSEPFFICFDIAPSFNRHQPYPHRRKRNCMWQPVNRLNKGVGVISKCITPVISTRFCIFLLNTFHATWWNS